MTNISLLAGFNDYYRDPAPWKRPEEVFIADSTPEDDTQATITKIQQNADVQQVVRKLQQIEQEIEKLSFSQAQLVMQMVSDKILNSTARQLSDVQQPVQHGLLSPAYV